MSISAGLSGILRPDANLRNFEITKDGGVKERGVLGKLFARISDHFGRQTAAGRATINRRNREVGKAMLNMVQSRTDAQLDALHYGPASETMTSEEMDARRNAIRNSAKSLFNRITLLRNCKEMSPEMLAKVKKLGPNTLGFLNAMQDVEVKDKVINLLTCDMDTTLFKIGVEDALRGTEGEDHTDVFYADAARNLVSCPAVPNSKGNPAAIHDYITHITHNVPMVKNFLINACNQEGLPFAVVDTLMGNAEWRDSRLPSFQECQQSDIGFGNLNDTKYPSRITLTTQEDGSINAHGDFYLKAFSSEGDLAGFKVSMDIHIPVNELGDFSTIRGKLNFDMSNVTVTNMPLK